MTVAQLMNALNEANLLARPYYNGVPDPTAVGRGYNEKRRETRSQVLARLSRINIAQVPSNTFDGVSLRDAVPVLSLLVNRGNAGAPLNIYVNQFLRGAAAKTTPAPSGVGGGNNPLGGLPGLGGGDMGMGGMPGGEDGGGAGDPFGGGGGAPQLNGQGAAVGVAQGGAFPGLPMGGPVMPGFGGGGPMDMGSKDLGAFRPERVKVTGFSTSMYDISAKDFLEEFVTHIQKDFEINPRSQGYDYKVTNLGIAIVEASADNFINGQRVYSRMIPVRPNLFGGQELKPPVIGGTGGGQQGGSRPGGGMGMGGQMGGMGGQMGGMGGQMGGMGGQMGGMGGQMGGMGGQMGGMGMGGGMGGQMGGMGMGGGMYRYRRGSGVQQIVPQASQSRYRSFNFRRR